MYSALHPVSSLGDLPGSLFASVCTELPHPPPRIGELCAVPEFGPSANLSWAVLCWNVFKNEINRVRNRVIEQGVA